MTGVEIKDITDLVTGVAALIAAVQSWRARSESKKASDLLTEIKTEITAKQTTNVTVINSPAQTIGSGAVPPKPEV